MEEIPRIGLRLIFTYVLLHQLLRHAGNRVVANGIGKGGEGAGIDFVLVLIIGDLVDDMLWAEVPAAQFVAAAGTLVLVHIGLGLLRQASTPWWRALEGTPAPALTRGTPLHAALRRQRVNDSALAALLRREGIDRDQWREIRAAYLENGGRLSVLRHRWAEPAIPADRARARELAT